MSCGIKHLWLAERFILLDYLDFNSNTPPPGYPEVCPLCFYLCLS